MLKGQVADRIRKRTWDVGDELLGFRKRGASAGKSPN